MPTPLGGSVAIAFSSNRDGEYDLYLMASDGKNPTQLIDWPTGDYFPEFSPNGDWILFLAIVVDPPALELWAITPDGESQMMVGKGPFNWGSWSPDGTELVLPGIWESGNFDILKMETDGNLIRLTSDPADDIECDWSPDGSTIAFTSYRDGQPQIFLMNSDGSNQRRLSSNNMTEMEPDWSPDGSMIALTTGDNVNTQIYIINADGTGLRKLVDATGFNENPTWSPDGKMIAFWSDRSGNREIYAIRIDGTGLIQLTDDPGEDENPSWAVYRP